MTRIKKLIVILLSAIIIICTFSVSASAVTVYDKAIKLSPMEFASGNFNKTAEYYYKIVVSKPGTITFYCAQYEYTDITLLDSSGNMMISNDYLNYKLNKGYKLSKKGNYYLKLEKRYSNSNCYFTNFYYGFKPDETIHVSLAVNMKVGETLDLSAIATGYKGNITWKSMKSSVTTVKKGTVKAVKKGTTQIRAYMNDGDYAEITVKVTK